MEAFAKIVNGFQPVLPIFEKDSTTDAWKSSEYVFEYNFQKQTWKTNDAKKRNRTSFNKIQWHWSLYIPLENIKKLTLSDVSRGKERDLWYKMEYIKPSDLKTNKTKNKN